MARDNFIGWTQQQKIEMLRGLQESRLTGQIVKVQTAPGVYTEFQPNNPNITQVLEELEVSIATSPDYDAEDPIQLACKNNIRPSITRPVFF